MDESNRLGDELERAVRAIEEMVIRADPGLSLAKFTIQPNAVVHRNGERYEVDVLVTVNEGSPYQTTHLFECKNRKGPASQADVTILADKVASLGAAKGTLVSREFSSCARAKAESAGICLSAFDDAVWFPLAAVQISALSHGFTRCTARVSRRGPQGGEAEPDWSSAVCTHRGLSTSFSLLVHGVATRWLAERRAFDRPFGTHVGSEKFQCSFDEAELLVGGWDVSELTIDFDYSISVRPTRLVSTFSVERKGRFARFECEPDPVDGTRVSVEMTGPFDTNSQQQDAP